MPKKRNKWEVAAWMATVAGAGIALLAYLKSDQPTIVNNVTLPKIENNARLEVNIKSSQEPAVVPRPEIAQTNATPLVVSNASFHFEPPLPSTNDTQAKSVTFPDDFPGFDKSWQITLDGNSPKRGGMGYYKEIPVRVTQGDKLRVRVEPVGGADMLIRMAVHVGPRDTDFDRPRKSGTLDWTMTKGIPGESARIRVYSMVPGTLNVVVSKAE
jgi:hypothetical protein